MATEISFGGGRGEGRRRKGKRGNRRKKREGGRWWKGKRGNRRKKREVGRGGRHSDILSTHVTVHGNTTLILLSWQH